MAVTVSRGDLVSFLEDSAPDGSRHLDYNPNGLCLLAGETAIRNLRTTLVSRGHAPQAVAHVETFQSAARKLSERWGNHRVLPDTVTRRLVEAVIDDARNGNAPRVLQAFVDAVGNRWNDELYETLLDELVTFWRMTDAGVDYELLADVVENIDDPYAAHRIERALRAFPALDTMLTERTEPLPNDLHLSKSHLVRAARDSVHSRWPDVYADVDWIALSSHKTLDNGMLRFIRTLAAIPGGPDIHCFFNAGTCDRMTSRFEQAGITLSEPPTAAQRTSSDIDGLVTTAATGQLTDAVTEDVTFVEAPDRRRELEQVARRISDLCDDAGSERTPGDFLVVVREVTPYESTLRDVFTSHGLPFHIEAQRPVAQTTAYRMVKATIDLIEADTAEKPVEYHEIVAPLRLGFCALGNAPGRWPVDDDAFLDIEERLHDVQLHKGGPRSVPAWRDIVTELSHDRGEAWAQVQTLLNWIEDRSVAPPEDGAALETLLNGLVEAYIAHTANNPVRASSGPGVDTTRTDIGQKHDTSLAREAVLNGLVKVRQYYNYLLELDLAEPSWSLAAQALGETLGGDQYSVPNRDGNAVRVVIPANTYFLETTHTYVVGLGADEFPVESPRPTFLHERFYETAWELSQTRNDPQSALLYAPSSEETFQRELDDYEATLRTASGRFTLSRHAHNAEGDEVSWSPFIDAIAAERDDEDPDYLRIRQSQWLPGPGWYGDWQTTTAESPMRDRLRLAVHHLREGVTGDTFIPRLSTEAIPDQGTLIRLLLSVDGNDYAAVGPGHQRFSSPLTQVTVDTAEPAFNTTGGLTDVIGDPVRAHELDLFTHCELKYYFYQYFAARRGTSITRDTWPSTESPAAAELYPTLPTLLRSHYAPDQFRQAMAAIIQDHLPNRQADLAAFDDVTELRTAFEDWRTSDDAVDESVFQTLVGEYLTVQQELTAGIHRDWEWIGGEDLKRTLGEHTIKLPAHRLDRVGGSNGAMLPVFASARPGASRIAVKNCWQSGSAGIRGETTDGVCASCGNRDRCSITTKRVIDSRVRTRMVSDDPIGALVLDRFQSAPGGRQGFYRDDGRFAPVDQERHLVPLDGGDWGFRERNWTRDMIDALEAMVPDEDTVTYEVERSFVENGGCEGCVYRDLCIVPYHIPETGAD